MNRQFEIKGIKFEVVNRRPRKNEFEHDLKYKLFVNGIPTEHVFSTVHRAKDFARANYFIWM